MSARYGTTIYKSSGDVIQLPLGMLVEEELLSLADRGAIIVTTLAWPNACVTRLWCVKNPNAGHVYETEALDLGP